MTERNKAMDLSAVSYANGFTFWHFRASEGDKVGEDPHFFDFAASMVRPGDLIVVNFPAFAESGETWVTTRFLSVEGQNSAAGTCVVGFVK